MMRILWMTWIFAGVAASSSAESLSGPMTYIANCPPESALGARIIRGEAEAEETAPGLLKGSLENSLGSVATFAAQQTGNALSVDLRWRDGSDTRAVLIVDFPTKTAIGLDSNGCDVTVIGTGQGN